MNLPRRSVAILHGGLGNQLFQFAAALGITEFSDPGQVRLVSYGSEWGPDHPDVTSLAGIPVEYPNRFMRSTLPGVAVRESWKDSVSVLLSQMWGSLASVRLIRQEDPFAGRIEITSGTKEVVLDGFFQHRDWWLDSWQQVARIINNHRPEGVDAIRAEGRTAVKLRRSDYLGRGIVLPDEYYLNALELLDIRDCEVVVVCEEADYVAHFATILAKRGCIAIAPERITGNVNVDDFWNLAAARRQVLANSSYCWWAAAVAEVASGAASVADPAAVAYPTPWLPNAWSTGPMPDMGIPGWIAVPTGFE